MGNTNSKCKYTSPITYYQQLQSYNAFNSTLPSFNSEIESAIIIAASNAYIAEIERVIGILSPLFNKDDTETLRLINRVLDKVYKYGSFEYCKQEDLQYIKFSPQTKEAFTDACDAFVILHADASDI